MTRLTRETQQIFGQNIGFQQAIEFGSLANSSTTYLTTPLTGASIPLIQSLSNWLTGWYGAVVGSNAPCIQDMNAMCYVFAYQLAYLMQAGIAEWDSGTTYFTGDTVNLPLVIFTISAGNATVGATYTNNGQTFTVHGTIASGLLLYTQNYTGLPTASGTLTKASGTGDATITFSAYHVSSAVYTSVVDSNLNNSIPNASYWSRLVPGIGAPFQKAAVDSTGQSSGYTYATINVQSADVSQDVPSGYNMTTGVLTIPSGLAWTVEGSLMCADSLTVNGTLTTTGISRVF